MPPFVKNFCRRRKRPPPQRRGISRSEFVVVTASLMVVLAIGIPALMQARAKARRQYCELRLARLGVALHQFEAELAEFPGFQNRGRQSAAPATVTVGWAATILPYLSSSAADEPRPGQPPLAEGPPPNREESSRDLPAPDDYLAALNCPAIGNQHEPVLSYIVNCGMPDAQRPPLDYRANGIFLNRVSGTDHVDRGYLQRHDGESSTLLMSENLDAGRWTDFDEFKTGFVWRAAFLDGVPAPGPELLAINQRPGTGTGNQLLPTARPSSLHPRGVNCLMADGSTAFLDQRIDYLVYVQLMTPDDEGTIDPETGEPPPNPYRRPPMPAEP
ncbi:MAG: DUF1559 domain-containing protein [Planctomycetes bacterium]|nr:DUF1559 domain-containing protein [Planctomycetota bacterium]